MLEPGFSCIFHLLPACLTLLSSTSMSPAVFFSLLRSQQPRRNSGPGVLDHQVLSTRLTESLTGLNEFDGQQCITTIKPLVILFKKSFFPISPLASFPSLQVYPLCRWTLLILYF